MWGEGASNEKDLNPQSATMQKGEGRIPKTPGFEAFVPMMPLKEIKMGHYLRVRSVKLLVVLGPKIKHSKI